MCFKIGFYKKVLCMDTLVNTKCVKKLYIIALHKKAENVFLTYLKIFISADVAK